MNDVNIINIPKPNHYGTLTWLHLSDIHVGQPNEEERRVILLRLIEDVEACRNTWNLLPDIIFVTGDIAFSGEGPQYDVALDFLERIRRVVQLPKDRVFIVPGNHDVDRQKTNRLSMALLEEHLLAKGAERDEKLIRSFLIEDDHRKDRVDLLDKHAAYVAFVSTHYPQCRPLGAPDYYVAKIDLPPGHNPAAVWILGLNTAWMGNAKETKNRLILGRAQIFQALATIGELGDQRNDLIIALTHHPLSWLTDWDEQDCKGGIESYCDFHLRGHLHEASLNLNGVPGPGRCSEIAAGAAHGDDRWHNGYNFVRLDFRSGKGRAFSRWFEPTTLQWKEDVKISRPEAGQYEWTLPDRFLRQHDSGVPKAIHIPDTKLVIDPYAPNLMLIPDEDEIDQRHRYDRITCDATIASDLSYLGTYTFRGVNESAETSFYLIIPFLAVGGHDPAEFDFRARDMMKQPPSSIEATFRRSESNVNKFKVLVWMKPVPHGGQFYVQVQFRLPAVMRRTNDYDVVGLTRFRRGVSEFEYAIKTSYSLVDPHCYAIHESGLQAVTMDSRREGELNVVTTRITDSADLALGFLFHYGRLD